MRRFYRGATIPLEFTHVEFSKAEWSAKLVLKGETSSTSFDATPSADSEKFEVKITAEQSALVETGTYQIHYRYESADGDVSFVQGCEVSFLLDPTTDGDQRSQFEQDLEAIDTAIRNKITGGAVEEYEIQTTVGQRSLKNMSLEDLRSHRRWVAAQVDRERIKSGRKPLSQNRWKKISSHLGNQSPVNRRIY